MKELILQSIYCVYIVTMYMLLKHCVDLTIKHEFTFNQRFLAVIIHILFFVLGTFMFCMLGILIEVV